MSPKNKTPETKKQFTLFRLDTALPVLINESEGLDENGHLISGRRKGKGSEKLDNIPQTSNDVPKVRAQSSWTQDYD